MNNVPPTGAPWIETTQISFSHGARPVIHDLNLSLSPGRHYIIAGPNGAGKSTLLDLIANLRRPDAGRIAVMGRPLPDYDPPSLARVIALAQQEFNLGFSFTVRELVAMGRRPYLGRWGRMNVTDHAAVDAALARLHLEPLSARPVTALSGGERRRCVVARTLAQATPIVLFDEPCAGLDVAQALAVMAVARDLAERGGLTVTISHDLNLAAAFGHEIIFLKDGRVAASGPVETVFTADVLSEIYETPARVRRDDFTDAPAVSFRRADAPC